MEKKNEIQKTEQVSPLMAVISAASTDGSVDADKLMKLLEVHERYEANEARKAYVVAMTAFKENPPKIFKDKVLSHTKSTYAGLGNVVEVISKSLSKHGLTSSWITGQDNASIKVTCKITHINGHSEETVLSAEPDKSGSKNAIQAIGSTVTYLERYTLLAATGLATYDMDNDGAGANDGPDKPEMTATNKKVMSAICKILTESVDGRTIDTDKVAGIFFAQKGSYPSDMKMTGAAASWLISLGRQESWLKPMSESDRVFAAYCKHFKEADISREAFDACLDGCKIELVDTQTGEQWIIENIPVKNTLA